MTTSAEARAFLAEHHLEAHVAQLALCAPPLPTRVTEVLSVARPSDEPHRKLASS